MAQPLEGRAPTADPWPTAATSPDLAQRIADARVLAVGAGGIGCELLKTLVMTGFKHIEVIDMDTIETSNLNRQFLFRKRHVGQSKALVAAEAAGGMRPGAHIVAHQANVKEARFGVDFFRRFDCVLNGLDNLEARRHVNRLCLAAGVPLVESGTAGYLGQVSAHLRGRTECFECQPKPTTKTYPVCTLRNTPDKPIHCVVWAKEMLFPLLFGAPGSSDLNDTVAAEEEGEDKPAADDPTFYERREGESSRQYAERVFRQQYCTKIKELWGMEHLWRSRPPPQPLDLDALLAPAGATDGAIAATTDGAAAGGKGDSAVGADAAGGGSVAKGLGLADAHAVWGLPQQAQLFLAATQAFLDGRADEVGSAQFDKDDALAVEFVAAASNLRAACYGIPVQSLFDAKGMAGNIIHAIATTNAIVSGLIVIEALKLLAGAPAACHTSFLHKEMSGSRRLVSRMSAPKPNPACMVCGTARATLAVDTHKMTLQQLVDKVIKGRLAVNVPWLNCGLFDYEEEEDQDECEADKCRKLLPRRLSDLPGGGLHNGSILAVADQGQRFRAELVLAHREEWDEEAHPEGFELSGALPAAQAKQEEAAAAPAGEAGAAAGGTAGAAAAAAAPAAAAGKANARVAVKENEDGDVLISSDEEEEATEAAVPGKGKRKAAEGPGEGGLGKRARVAGGGAAAAAAAEAEDVVDLLDSDSD